MNGYVKPMFANLEVNKLPEEQGTGLLHQAKELMIGVASHLFKNRRTERVVTR
jgi:hypothetical protein